VQTKYVSIERKTYIIFLRPQTDIIMHLEITFFCVLFKIAQAS